jgi:hypothetical protein
MTPRIRLSAPHLFFSFTFLLRDYSLFDPQKLPHSFLGPENFFVPYLTSASSFIPHLTPSFVPLPSTVKTQFEIVSFLVEGQKYP